MILFDLKFWFILGAAFVLYLYQRKYKPKKYGMFLVRLFHGFFAALLADMVLNFTPGEVFLITLIITNLFYTLDMSNGEFR